MEAYFNRFTLELSEEQAHIGSHQGDCSEDVNYLLTLPEIAAQFENINPADIAAELKEYGAWDDEELRDAEKNQQRILWIACGDIVALTQKVFGED